MTDSPNDPNDLNDNAHFPMSESGSDAQGQAAMLLVESLLHGLIARSVISLKDAIEIVDIASDVKDEIAADRGYQSSATAGSFARLASIHASLSADLPDG